MCLAASVCLPWLLVVGGLDRYEPCGAWCGRCWLLDRWLLFSVGFRVGGPGPWDHLDALALGWSLLTGWGVLDWVALVCVRMSGGSGLPAEWKSGATIVR